MKLLIQSLDNLKLLNKTCKNIWKLKILMHNFNLMNQKKNSNQSKSILSQPNKKYFQN